ncbi:uncharacterized protein LOC112270714 [Brachypodium distachyon]|uniref:uncharacterized protein LOC112270714 n=1 Tax=Brachypodium distachyon TaxID=15368 RepID=UPI000D0E307F|nr:uncharacterized protein LOC112270714 [Brachypodium distachyon]|eukprot:XP_024314534.1 uncharacterized protein LOC112270714 [Brachypodium distachyon]
MAAISQSDAACIGGFRLAKHAPHLPAEGTRGDILLLWDENSVALSDVSFGTYSASAMVTILECETYFKLTLSMQKWLILGDFNLIYRACDKNNRNVNLRLMGQFCRALEDCNLKEINLQNRKFTWSNERESPTLVKLDRAFYNNAWDLAFDNHTLHLVHIVNHKLKLTASRLRSWSKFLFSHSKLLLLMALDVVFQLDVVQENRSLTPEERGLRSDLKRRILALASLERARKKQFATIAWLKEGDANSKFFHIRANGHRRKNHIQRLRVGNDWHDLDDLDLPFSEEEILKAIIESPADKAPGPDGFTGNFFRAFWPIIKDDIMCLANAFRRQETHNLHICNTANTILIPKKDGADSISDYRPISLIHAMAKILSKAMVMRLRPKMHELVSLSQSAFIKSRSIHDNFMFVQGMARRLHRSKSPTLLIKLDIAKAFDTVRWDFILELLQRRGFPNRFPYIIDKAAGRLAIWKGKLLTSAGCLTLVKSVMTSIPIFSLSAIRPSKGVLQDFDKLCRNFQWSGSDKASDGQCKINWQRERNARVFNNVHTLPQVLIEWIKDEGRAWALTGAKHLASILP